MRSNRGRTGAGLGSGDLPSLTVWIAKRLALSVLILLGVSILVFAATQALPGDPAQQILGHAAARRAARGAARASSASIARCVSQYFALARRPAAAARSAPR